MRTGIAAQEILQSLQLWRFPPPDQRRAACAGFDQPDATEDQRTDNTLAKIRLGDDESAQLRRRHQKGLDILLGMPVHQRLATGKLRDLGRKFAGSEAHDTNHMAQAVALAERHGTFQHDKHAGTRLAGSEETGTALVAPKGTELADAPDLGPRQHRKHLMATGSDDARYIVNQR
jgi:hypothetical protein